MTPTERTRQAEQQAAQILTQIRALIDACPMRLSPEDAEEYRRQSEIRRAAQAAYHAIDDALVSLEVGR